MTTENMALAALLFSVFGFGVATTTAVLDVWVWVKVSKICRDAADSAKKEETK